MIKLNTENLSLIPKEIPVPLYNRSEINTGIVHIGVGNFHRAHQAFYTEQILQSGNSEWGICGVGIMERDLQMYNALKEQDGLYTLVVMESDGNMQVRVIGSIVELLYGPENPCLIIEKMADPDVKIISLTITEGGYNYDSATGEFIMSDPVIQRDLEHPENPETVFGYLTQSLKRRRDRQIPGLTILSCDNIQHNGDVCRKMLLAYMKEAEPGLMDWVEDHCSFPNSMVDRITPATTQYHVEILKNQFGIDDRCPVTCEPFIQWVIEDDFANGRPEWESAGVQFVKDVSPYEKMKIRLLNAGHSLLGFAGALIGFQTIDETVNDPLCRQYLRQFMDKEVTQILGQIEGIDLEKYKDTLIERFGNSNIRDLLLRICGESSAKIPKFLLLTIREQLDRGGPVECGILVVAMWCRYVELAGTPGHSFEVQDAIRNELIQAASDSIAGDHLSFLKVESVFGDLVHNERFVQKYIDMINKLRTTGIKETIRDILDYSW